MRFFITRIELHNLPSVDWHAIYGQLHKEMASRHFTVVITGGNKKTHNLPNATYRSQGEDTLTAVAVRELAKAAINATKEWATEQGINASFTSSILAVQYVSAAWSGLKVV